MSHEERFWSKVRKTDTCWIWIGSKFAIGYGAFWLSGQNRLAHRVSLALSGVDVTDDKCVLHSCDNKLCVNPYHLSLGTRAENSEDMVSKLRSCKGRRNPESKLTEADVKNIKSLRDKGMSLKDIGKMYNIHLSTVSKIWHGRNWVWLE